jgi:hypothetical protein
MAAADIAEALRAARKRDLNRFLESDPRVREWLGSGVLLSTKEAADLLEVERARVWRWTQAGRITAVAHTAASPLYLRCDVERLKRENDDRAARKAAAQAA